jgi:uncharacterized protein (UPF0248 family)
LRGRGEIYEVVARLYHQGFRGYIVVVWRGGSTGLARISFNDVVRVARGFLELRDGTIIPLHRIVAVEDERGRRVWSRY